MVYPPQGKQSNIDDSTLRWSGSMNATDADAESASFGAS